MGEVIQMSEYGYWRETLSVTDENDTSLQIFVNTRTNETEIVQMNSEGEAIRSLLSALDADLLISSLQAVKAKKAK